MSQHQQQDVEMNQVDPIQHKNLQSDITNKNINKVNTTIESSTSQLITENKDYHFLPSIDIQHDWHLYLQSDSDCFWLTYHNDMKSSVHSSVRTKKLNKDNFELEPENNFHVDSSPYKKNKILISYNNYQQEVIAPSKQFRVAGNHRITSLGVSCENGIAAYGSSDGILEIFETETGHIRRKLQGHVGDVDVTMFFPSGKVLLSGASDARLKIWDALEGNCATTLTGHTGGITSASFVERGRNLVSTSRDGSAKLWDIPTGSTIQTLQVNDRPINDCFVFSSCNMSENNNNNSEKEISNLDEREFGTSGKLVLLAMEDGSLLLNDIRSNKIFSKFGSPNHKVAFNACTVLSNQIYGGDEDGCIYEFDKRNLEKPLNILQFTKSPIHHLKSSTFGNDRFLWCAASDGGIFSIDILKHSIVKSLSGIDTDVVTALDFSGNQAFATCRDPFVRIYDI